MQCMVLHCGDLNLRIFSCLFSLFHLYNIKSFTLSGDFNSVSVSASPISPLRYQLWPLDKKLRIIKTAKDYVKRHESELKEKMDQNRNFGSIVKAGKMMFVRFMQVRSVPLKKYIRALKQCSY